MRSKLFKPVGRFVLSFHGWPAVLSPFLHTFPFFYYSALISESLFKAAMGGKRAVRTEVGKMSLRFEVKVSLQLLLQDSPSLRKRRGRERKETPK